MIKRISGISVCTVWYSKTWQKIHCLAPQKTNSLGSDQSKLIRKPCDSRLHPCEIQFVERTTWASEQFIFHQAVIIHLVLLLGMSGQQPQPRSKRLGALPPMPSSKPPPVPFFVKPSSFTTNLQQPRRPLRSPLPRPDEPKVSGEKICNP